MIIPDLNLLLYAYNDRAPDHVPTKTWWETCLNGSEPVGIPWIVSAGFIRMITNPKIFRTPITNAAAIEIVKSWLTQPCARVLNPGPDHAEHFFRFLIACGTAGNLTTDAQLAALAVEHQATLYSNDSDFVRFDGLRWKNPLKQRPR